MPRDLQIECRVASESVRDRQDIPGTFRVEIVSLLGDAADEFQMIRDEVEFAERRLQDFCNRAWAKEVHHDPREFRRQIDAQFMAIRKAAGMPENPDDTMEARRV